MKEQLITNETVVLAMKKGFKVTDYISFDEEYENNNFDADKNYRGWYYDISQSVLQKWLREKHNMHIWVEPVPTEQKEVCMYKWYGIVRTYGSADVEETFEEALEDALQEHLKLI